MKKFFIAAVFIFISYYSSSQWQNDVRLTNNTAMSSTSLNNARNVSSTGSLVHVVWHDDRDGNDEIYYKRSVDGGLNWGTDTRLTNNDTFSLAPSVFSIGQALHVVWHEIRDGNYEIYYKRSPNSGGTWGADTRLTVNSALSTNPSVCAVMVTSHVVHLVWREYRDGNDEIYYKRSIDGGTTWGNDVRLTDNSSNSINPTVSAEGLNVNVTWYDNRDGNYEVYYKRSPDGGTTWGNDVRLTNFALPSFGPTVSATGLNVYVTWWDSRDGNSEIYFKRSVDGGASWSPDMRLTNNTAQSSYPSISASGQAISIVWIDTRDGNQELYYKRSLDGGVTWDNDLRLTVNSALTDYPSVSLSGQAVHVVWRDTRDGNYEIYYKLNPTGAYVGIIQVHTEIPRQVSLGQNYPNPFNPSTNFEFRIADFGFVKLTIFDLLGREITVLVNEELRPGIYDVEWNASDFPSGIYFYKIIAGNYSETKKMVLIK